MAPLATSAFLAPPSSSPCETASWWTIQGQDADKLSVLRESEANATLCELGIGANYAARLRGILLEDEKAYHTIHVAFGTNDDFGGTNKATCHMDGIIKNPTLYLDDVLVMRDGEYLI